MTVKHVLIGTSDGVFAYLAGRCEWPRRRVGRVRMVMGAGPVLGHGRVVEIEVPL